MKNPIPYGRQNITQEDIDAVTSVLRSKMITQGDKVPEFEKAVAKETNAKYGIAVNSATSALHIACLALGLGRGDVLWTSPISFVASANCALYCGSDVDFVDIDETTGLMDPEKLREKLLVTLPKKRPKIIIVVHIAGTSCNMKEIHDLAKEYNIKVIEDASHAIGGRYRGRKIGECVYSELTVFSFHPVKIITTGEGGMVMTNREELFKKMVRLRSHGITKNTEEFTQKSKGSWYYEQQDLGFNYRMTDIQAALGISQLKRLKSIIEKRNQIIRWYEKRLSDNEDIRLLRSSKDCQSAYHLAIIQLIKANKMQHKWVFEKMRSRNIGVQLHYEPIHLNPYYRDKGFKEGQLPNAEKYAEISMSLPIYEELDEKTVDYICKELKTIVKNGKSS